MAWLEIGFWQGAFGRAVADIVTNTHGVLVRGITVPTAAAGIHFLAQWDQGDDDILTEVETIPTYPGDYAPWYFDGYAIVVNVGLGTVALFRQSGEDWYRESTCLVCGDPIDYCPGGHNSSVSDDDTRTEYEIADDEYDAAYAALGAATADIW